MAGQTSFLESNALLAVLRDDEAEAQRILGEMLPNELRALAAACNDLKWMARDEARRASRENRR